jgi:lipopolysaccharide export LptBFGC system permease protein LptF
MRILTRYVLKEFLVPLFYCLTGFLSIYVLFDLFG